MNKFNALLRACVLAAGLTAGVMGSAQAQTTDVAASYPQRPVTILVGFAPGGPTDIIGRMIADELTRELGQTFVVDNKAGADGNIATVAAVRAQPDGYTLLLMTVANATSMSVHKNPGYNTSKDLLPIAQLMASPSVLATSTKSPITSVQMFIKEAKARPEAMSFASTGVGGSPHLAGEMLKARAGIDMVHVPYKGAAPVLTDLLAGRVSVSFMTALGALKYMQSDQLRPLAVAFGSRLPALPDVPTMAEAGVPNFEVSSWNGLAAPAGTPKPIVDKLAAAVSRILQKPAIQERITSQGGIIVQRTPQEFSAYVQAEIDKWAQVVKTARIEVD
jgi:tripartite-type tricarboxylate transporter receptor subunit TctC